jgi:hypothetical protein
MSENTSEDSELNNPPEDVESEDDVQEELGRDSADKAVSKSNEPTTLNRRNRIGETLKAAPEAREEIQKEWAEEPLQAYFFGYSILAAIAMLLAMRAGGSWLLYGVFGLYAITAIPALYLYEETPYFSREENPFLSNGSSNESYGEEQEDDRH